MGNCIKCGQCCQQINFRIPLDPDLADLFSAHYGHRVNATGITVEHRCVHLGDDNLCKIYENRPEYCRNFFCQNPGLIVIKGKG